jgi:hypothetical protein
MTRLELKAIMAAIVASGYRAAETFDPEERDSLGSRELARLAVQDSERVLLLVEERSTADDNQPLVYLAPETQP